MLLQLPLRRFAGETAHVVPALPRAGWSLATGASTHFGSPPQSPRPLVRTLPPLAPHHSVRLCGPAASPAATWPFAGYHRLLPRLLPGARTLGTGATSDSHLPSSLFRLAFTPVLTGHHPGSDRTTARCPGLKRPFLTLKHPWLAIFDQSCTLY